MNRKILLTFSFILIFGLSVYEYNYNNGITKYPQGPNITSSDRVLIVAPHPDDETLASAGIIRYCIKNNIPIYVVIVTNGGNSELGIIRYHETLNATKILGLPPNNITFFDYTQGVDLLFNDNWDNNNPLNVNGNHTENTFAYQRNEPYTGVSLEKNFESLITNFKPTIIIYPYSNDVNPDHWGTSSFVGYATNNLNYTGQKYSYIVHISSLWPFPRSYSPQTNLLPPSFLNQNKWLVFPLTNSDEILKKDAINSYKSQLYPDPTYLISFVKKMSCSCLMNRKH